MKTETVAEFLARGGKITKLTNGTDCPPLSVVGPSSRSKRPLDHDDRKDGLSPNLRWIGDRHYASATKREKKL